MFHRTAAFKLDPKQNDSRIEDRYSRLRRHRITVEVADKIAWPSNDTFEPSKPRNRSTDAAAGSKVEVDGKIFAGLYRGPVGVVTIDSWPQLFRRLKKERLETRGWKDIPPRHIFLFVQGARRQHPDNMGSFYVFSYMGAGRCPSDRLISIFSRRGSRPPIPGYSLEARPERAIKIVELLLFWKLYAGTGNCP